MSIARICTCDRIPEKGQPYDQSYCWLCYLFHTNNDYNRLFGGDGKEKPKRSGQRLRQYASEKTFAEASTVKKVWDFAKAITIELEWRASGGSAPTDVEKAERRKHCDTNLCKMLDTEKDACLFCGCYLEAGLFPPRPLGKLDCSSQACPKGYWGVLGGFKAKSRCGG